jgi:hypothetical protein
MRRLVCTAAVLSLALGTLALSGCGSSASDTVVAEDLSKRVYDQLVQLPGADSAEKFGLQEVVCAPVEGPIWKCLVVLNDPSWNTHINVRLNGNAWTTDVGVEGTLTE